MTNNFKDMMYLLGCTARGQKAVLSEEMDYIKICNLSFQQQIISLIFPEIECAYNENYFKVSDDKIKSLKDRIFKSVLVGVQKKEILKNVLNKMDEKGVVCVLLKGDLLADLYSQPEYRLSGDIDLFVKPTDEDKAIEVLKSCGFDVKKRLKTEYHSECKHPVISELELHISLYEDYCSDLWFDNTTYNFDDVFEFTTKAGYTYNVLGLDDQLTFNVLHLIKHFLSGGAGIRQIMDVVLFIEKYKGELDENRFIETMKALNFEYFINACMKIAVKYLGSKKENLIWIEGAEVSDEQCEKILDDIEHGGLFGHNDISRSEFKDAYTKAIHRKKYNDSFKTYSNKRKKTVWLSLLFLDYERMKTKYRYIENRKWLLPFAWVHRLFNYLFKKEKIKPEKTDNTNQRLEFLKELNII